MRTRKISAAAALIDVSSSAVRGWERLSGRRAGTGCTR